MARTLREGDQFKKKGSKLTLTTTGREGRLATEHSVSKKNPREHVSSMLHVFSGATFLAGPDDGIPAFHHAGSFHPYFTRYSYDGRFSSSIASLACLVTPSVAYLLKRPPSLLTAYSGPMRSTKPS